MSSVPIIEEIEDEIKAITLTSTDKRKIKTGLQSLDKLSGEITRQLSNDKLTEKNLLVLQIAIDAKRFLGTSDYDRFVDQFRTEMMKTVPTDRKALMVVYDMLMSVRYEYLQIEASKGHEMKLAAYKAGYNPLAMDEAKLAAAISNRELGQDILVSAVGATLSGVAAYKSTSAVDIIAQTLNKASDYLSSFEACSGSDASWLSVERVSCSLSQNLFHPVRQAASSVASGLGTVAVDVRFSAVLMLGILLFVAIFLFMVTIRKVARTKRLYVSLLGGIEFGFSSEDTCSCKRKSQRASRKKRNHGSRRRLQNS